MWSGHSNGSIVRNAAVGCIWSNGGIEPEADVSLIQLCCDAANDGSEPEAGIGSLLFLEILSNFLSGCLINSNPGVIYETI